MPATLDPGGAHPSRDVFLGVSLKMYFDHLATLAWAERIAQTLRARRADMDGVEVAVFPSFPSLDAVGEILAGSKCLLGAQNVAAADSGPYTGEVSAQSLVQVGCRYVEVGHAERRELFGEGEDVAGAKIAAALRAGLVPLLCLGEKQPGGPAAAVAECLRQATVSLGPALSERPGAEVVLAYEPVWAIGQDNPADIGHISATCSGLREGLDQALPNLRARVVYGGSAGTGLIPELGQAVDGLFLGRFAHDPSVFAQVLDEAITLRLEAR
jgi:triosephosphate isomerase